MEIIKRLFVFLLSLCVFFVGSVTLLRKTYIYNGESSEQIYACEKSGTNEENDNDKMCFSVISDVHIMKDHEYQDKKFKTALNTLKKLSGGRLDAVAIAGDLADSGSKYEYRKLMKIYNYELSKDTAKIFVMGNHDYNCNLNDYMCQQQFIRETGEKLNDDKVVKGYHFISVSTEDRSMNGRFGLYTRKWLKAHLDKAVSEDSTKPIFVIGHQPIRNTIYGSEECSNVELGTVLKNYPQVIYFAGHSHRPINDERIIYQKDFTAVGTGSIKDACMERTAANHYEVLQNDVSQGLFVEVKGNTVTINRVDFLKKQFMGKKWIIENPSDKKQYAYTIDRRNLSSKPYFIMNSKVNLVTAKTNSLKLQFKKAYNVDGFIERYNINIIDTTTGKNVKSEYIFSDYFAQKQSIKFNVVLKNLKSGHHYKIVISAVGEFGVQSTNKIEGVFKTL